MGNPRSHAWMLSGLLAFGWIVSVFLGVWDRAEAWTAGTLAFLGQESKEIAPPAVRIVLIIGGVTLCGWAAGAYRRLAPALAWLLISGFLTGSFVVAMAVTGWIVEPFSTWLASLSVFTLVAFMHWRARKRFRLLERSGLLSRLAPVTVRKLTESKSPLEIEEGPAQVSLVTLTIRQDASNEDSRRVAALLHKAEQILLERGGCLETRAGDHLQVYFGLPKRIAHHGKRACRAAIAVKAELGAVAIPNDLPCGLSVVSGHVVAGCHNARRAQNDYAISGTLLEEGRRLARRHASSAPRLAVSPELEAILDGESEKSPAVMTPALGRTAPSAPSS